MSKIPKFTKNGLQVAKRSLSKKRTSIWLPNSPIFFTFFSQICLFLVNFGKIWPFLVIFGHLWPLLFTSSHFWSLLVTSDQFWWLLVISGHFWSFLVTSGRYWSILAVPFLPLFVQILLRFGFKGPLGNFKLFLRFLATRASFWNRCKDYSWSF